MVPRDVSRGGAYSAESRRAVVGGLTPRRLRRSEQWPPAPPPRPFATALRVKHAFACRGLTFHKGALLSPDDPLVREIAQQHPNYLERAT